MAAGWHVADPQSLKVACPKCKAEPLQRCVTSYGAATSTHKARRTAGALAAEEPGRAERDRAVKIAAVALNRAMANDLPGAADYVQRLNGSPALLIAVVAWIDTYIARLYPDHKRGEPLRIAWYHTGEGRVETADEVDAPMRWAGRMIAARAMDDEEQFYAVLHSAPEGRGLGDGIISLLHVVATGLNDPEMIHRVRGEVG